MAKLDIPPIPTRAQLVEILTMAFGEKPPKKFADDICELLQKSPEMMSVLERWQNTVSDKVSMATVGSLFSGGFITGYLMAFALMKLEEN